MPRRTRKTMPPQSPRQQQAAAERHVLAAKRYRVAGDAANMLVSTAYTTAREIKLDPLLILAVMAIESGLNPFAESPMGAKGLMQVMAKVHHDKFEEVGGAKAALDPVANIRVGAQILKDYVKRRFGRRRPEDLCRRGRHGDDSGYGAKVLAEYKRLKMVARRQEGPDLDPRPPAPTQMVDKAAPAAPAARRRPRKRPSRKAEALATL
jgi:soluble lytic murein transglycosylase-like protein